jgi:uncharacterized RmlC-like cupin family protein
MAQLRPMVIAAVGRAPELVPPTLGMERREILEDGNTWVGWVRADAGKVIDWHHHGDRDSYIYVVGGGITIEFGPGGREQLTASAGDFILSPARAVHRETMAPDATAEFFVVRVGSGPQNVNVGGPDPD